MLTTDTTAESTETDAEGKKATRVSFRAQLTKLLDPISPEVFRREDMTLSELWKHYVKVRSKWFITFVGVYIVFFCLITVPRYGDQNAAADARGRIVQSMRMEHLPPEQRPAARKKLSSELLSSFQAGILSDVNYGADTPAHGNAVFGQLVRSQKYGTPVELDTAHQNWTQHLDDVAQRFCIVIFVILSLVASAAYGLRTVVRHEYLVNLPWKKGWPILFMTLLPILWPFLIVSVIRFQRVEWEGDSFAKEEKPQEAFSFVADEAAARQLYFDLRFGDWQKFVSDRRAAIDKRLEALATSARMRQQERSGLQAEMSRLEDFDITVDSSDSADVAAEFQKLLDEPRIIGLSREGKSLLIHTAARYDYQGTTYDLGDWLITVSTSGLKTKEVRRGTKPAWHGGVPPVYRYDDGSFCFGTRKPTIDKRLLEGNISGAIIMAVDCLNAVNDADRELVPEAFEVADAT